MLVGSRHEFRDVDHLLRQRVRRLLFRTTLEKLLVFLEHERAGGAARDDLIIARQGLQIEASIVFDQIHMSIGFDRRPGTTLRRKFRLYVMFAQDGNDRVPHPVLEVVRCAAMKVGDAGAGLGLRRSRELRIPVAQVGGRECGQDHVRRKFGRQGDAF
jgi:hypothetical protein